MNHQASRPFKISKSSIVEKIIERLQSEMQAQMRAAKTAHEEATHAESRAEDQHDTRGLEASYLAGAQASRAAELQATISVYRLMPLHDWLELEPIAPGALVELELQESGSRCSHYFIAPSGGGISVNAEGATVQVITPQSPMGEALIGRKVGDPIDVEIKDAVREYRVVAVS